MHIGSILENVLQKFPIEPSFVSKYAPPCLPFSVPLSPQALKTIHSGWRRRTAIEEVHIHKWSAIPIDIRRWHHNLFGFADDDHQNKVKALFSYGSSIPQRPVPTDDTRADIV